jgi:hypothetical protein
MSYVEDYRIHARSPRYQVLEAVARIHEGMKLNARWLHAAEKVQW